MKTEKPGYSTWIRSRRMILLLLLTLLSLGGLPFAVLSPWFLLLILPAALFGYISLIIILSHYRLSAGGGDYQNKLHDLLISFIQPGEGQENLDIGCGSGNLAVKIARKDPASKVVGVDYWGTEWGYSLDQCEKNARLEGVGERISFTRGTASRLELEDDRFDQVVSCLTFHEVKDVKEKILCLGEALRVLKPSGRFILFDLFLNPGIYPPLEEIKKYIESKGGTIEEMKKLEEYFHLPFPLKSSQVLGHGVLIVGKKR